MIPDNVPVNTWAGNGSSTIFDFDFLINNDSELLVEHSVGEEKPVTLELNKDYKINTELKNANGGNITFPISGSKYSVLGKGEKITLSLKIPIAQSTPYGTSAKLNLKSIELSFDYVTRLIQILSRKVDRSLKVQEGSSVNTDQLRQDLIIVADNITDINTIAANISDVNIVVDKISSVCTVSDSIENVNAVGNNIEIVVAVDNNKGNIDAVADNKSNIDTVAGSIANVRTVSNNISNVNTTATNISNVNIVGKNIADVNTVATNIKQINSCSENIAAIIQAPEQASIATTKAAEASESAEVCKKLKEDISAFDFIDGGLAYSNPLDIIDGGSANNNELDIISGSDAYGLFRITFDDMTNINHLTGLLETVKNLSKQVAVMSEIITNLSSNIDGGNAYA